MCQRCDPARIANTFDAFREGRLAPVDVPGRGFIQVIVESLLKGGDIALFQHDLREMRARCQTAAAGLNFIERDLEAQISKARSQPHIPIAPVSLEFQNPIPELLRWRPIEKISENV